MSGDFGRVLRLAALWTDEDADPLARAGWHVDAACRGTMTGGVSPHFPSTPDVSRFDPYREARVLCARCPVRAECAEAGLTELTGMWGGLTPVERRVLRRERGVV